MIIIVHSYLSSKIIIIGLGHSYLSSTIIMIGLCTTILMTDRLRYTSSIIAYSVRHRTKLTLPLCSALGCTGGNTIHKPRSSSTLPDDIIRT